MRSMNSIFSGRYYIYSLKRILPYALAMTAIMIVLNVMTYVVNNPFGYETCIYTVNISFVTIPLMYLYPVLLSVGLFNFLHKKNKSDFFGSSPIKRTSLFITNIIVGFTVIAGMLLINTFVLLAIVKTNYALNIASPMIFFEHFIVWLAGYMVVFAIASLAASISGTVIAQLLATCIFLFLPAFLAYMVQAPLFEGMNNPNLSNYTAVTSDLFYLNTVSMDSIFMFRSYHTLLFAFLFNFNGFYGFGNIAGLLNILYNFILAAGVIILGAVMLKKRSFETAEMPFKNNIILDVMLGLAFFPLFFIGVMTIEATFSVMIMLLIAYVVANMVMHKGLKNFGHSLTVLICSMVLAVSCYAFCNLSINHIRDNGIKETSVDSVESIDLYMSPIDMKMNSKIYYKDRIKVNISDKNLIKQMLTSLGDYSREVISVNLDNGKKYTNIFTVSESSYTALYEYIQNDQTLIKKLSSYEDVPVLDSYLMTNGNESVNENDRIPLGKLNGNIMNTIKESRKNMSVAQRYSFNEINNNDVNGGIELENKDSEQYSVISYRYIGGEYYSDRYVLDKDSELANNVLKQVNDKALSEINNFKNKNTVLRIISYPQKYDDNYLQKEVFEDIISNILINYHDEVIENIASNIDNDFSGENLCRIALYKSKYPGYMGSDSGKYYGDDLFIREIPDLNVFINYQKVFSGLIEKYKHDLNNKMNNINAGEIRAVSVISDDKGQILSPYLYERNGSYTVSDNYGSESVRYTEFYSDLLKLIQSDFDSFIKNPDSADIEQYEYKLTFYLKNGEKYTLYSDKENWRIAEAFLMHPELPFRNFPDIESYITKIEADGTVFDKNNALYKDLLLCISSEKNYYDYYSKYYGDNYKYDIEEDLISIDITVYWTDADSSELTAQIPTKLYNDIQAAKKTS